MTPVRIELQPESYVLSPIFYHSPLDHLQLSQQRDIFRIGKDRATLPPNAGRDGPFPAKTSTQLVLDGRSVLPALEVSADLQRADVEKRRMPDELLDGSVERQMKVIVYGDTRAQLRQTVNALDVANIEPAVDPTVLLRVMTQHRWPGT